MFSFFFVLTRHCAYISDSIYIYLYIRVFQLNVSLGIHSLHLQALFPSKSSIITVTCVSMYEKEKKKERLRSASNVFRIYMLQPIFQLKDILYYSRTFLADTRLRNEVMQNCMLWKNISLNESYPYTGMFLLIH